MNRVPALLFVAALAGIVPAVAAPPRPNIVFFRADDLGRADVSWRGSRDAGLADPATRRLTRTAVARWITRRQEPPGAGR